MATRQSRAKKKADVHQKNRISQYFTKQNVFERYHKIMANGKLYVLCSLVTKYNVSEFFSSIDATTPSTESTSAAININTNISDGMDNTNQTFYDPCDGHTIESHAMTSEQTIDTHHQEPAVLNKQHRNSSPSNDLQVVETSVDKHNGSVEMPSTNALGDCIHLKIKKSNATEVKKYKKQLVEYGLIISNKTVKINQLQEKNEILSQHFETESVQKSLLSEIDLHELRKISCHDSYDRYFVRQALLKLYKSDLICLRNKSLTGRKPRVHKLKDGSSKQHQPKEPLTPKKHSYIRSLYEIRTGSYDIRRKQLNNHISNSLIKIIEKMNNDDKKI